MPVDIFGHTNVKNSQRTVAGGVTLSQVNNTFMRRDGETAADGDLNLNDHKLINVKDPVDSQDAATKSYVDKRVSKSGDTMTGNLNLMLNEDSMRTFGVSDINDGKSVTLLLGNIDNQIRHNFEYPWKINTTNGLRVFCSSGEVCQMGSKTDAKVRILKDITMKNNSIKDLHEPLDGKDATTKQYVDNLPKKCYSGYIPILEANNSCLGFSVISSTISHPKYQPFGAFNHLNLDGYNGCWLTNTTTGWLQVKCPEQVRIWRVALKARNIPGRDITSWNLSASNDGLNFTTLLTSNTVLLGAATTPTFINITTNEAYQYYRLNITASTGSIDVGVQVMQLYVYSA